MKPEQKKIAILTVAFNRGNTLDSCLKNIRKSKNPELYDIFVIDNASTEDIQKITNKHSAKYFRMQKNYFVSRALNEGFTHFKIADTYDYAIFMGSDVLVDRDMLMQLTRTMDSDPTIGKTGPAHYEINSNILRTYGLNIDKVKSTLINFLDPKIREGMNHFHSLYMIRSDVFNTLGGFNSILYPMIYEEPDIGERILKLGYKIVSSPQAKIWHPLDDMGTNQEEIKVRKDRLYSNKPKAYLFFRNRIIYMSLHSNFVQFLIFLVFYNTALFIYYLPDIKPSLIGDALRGMLDGIIFALTKNEQYIAGRNKNILNI